MKSSRGFTLLEILVVLVIGALLVALASLSLTRNAHSDLIEQGQRLALVLETAQDEAQVRDAPIEWRPVAGGYRFAVLDHGRWKPLSDSLLGPTRWAEPLNDVAIRYPGENGQNMHASALTFDTESIGQAATITLYSDSGSVSIETDGSGRFAVRDGAAR